MPSTVDNASIFPASFDCDNVLFPDGLYAVNPEQQQPDAGNAIKGF